MVRPRQFTLAQLLVEVSFIAATLGAIRLIFVLWGHDWAHNTVMFPLVFSVPVLGGAAIGGLFGRSKAGALCGAGAFLLWLGFFAPGVQ
jgi:hypothetical protein